MTVLAKVIVTNLKEVLRIFIAHSHIVHQNTDTKILKHIHIILVGQPLFAKMSMIEIGIQQQQDGFLIPHLYPSLNFLPHVFVFGEVYGDDFGLDRILFFNLFSNSVKLVLAATDQHNIHTLLGQVQTESFA